MRRLEAGAGKRPAALQQFTLRAVRISGGERLRLHVRDLNINSGAPAEFFFATTRCWNFISRVPFIHCLATQNSERDDGEPMVWYQRQKD